MKLNPCVSRLRCTAESKCKCSMKTTFNPWCATIKGVHEDDPVPRGRRGAQTLKALKNYTIAPPPPPPLFTSSQNEVAIDYFDTPHAAFCNMLLFLDAMRKLYIFLFFLGKVFTAKKHWNSSSNGFALEKNVEKYTICLRNISKFGWNNLWKCSCQCKTDILKQFQQFHLCNRAHLCLCRLMHQLFYPLSIHRHTIHF